MRDLAHSHGIPMSINVAGSMFGIFFTDVEKVTNYQQAISCNTKQFNQFYHGMLKHGVYLAPASYEAGFVSKAHTAEIVADTLSAADKAFAAIDK
jgi:glutamate-1-semialdehyde 2,1-aminomutase